jgi:hypothetical protein
MAKEPRRLLSARHRKVEQVVSLFRREIPAGELDDHDWESFRVAVRIVYETEDLGALLGHKATNARELKISVWSDSIEGAITFMSWTRELAHIVTGMVYSKSAPMNVGALWRRHRVLAQRLLVPGLVAAKRLSVLVELGGIEVSLWGQTWALEPMYHRLAAKRQSGKAARKRTG